MNSLYQLILVHLKTFVREPAILFWAILFPILMAWVLGIAFSSQGESTRTVYVTGAGIPEAITGTKTFGSDEEIPTRVRFENHSHEQAVRENQERDDDDGDQAIHGSPSESGLAAG